MCFSSLLTVFSIVDSYAQCDLPCTNTSLPCDEQVKIQTLSFCVSNYIVPTASIDGSCVVLTWIVPNNINNFRALHVYYTSLSDNVCDMWQINSSTFTNTTARFPISALTTGNQYAFLIAYEYASQSPFQICDYTGITVPVASGWSNTKTIDIESCVNPTDIIFSNITNNSAKVSWTDLGCNSSYILEYKKESASTWTTINAISNTEYTLTGLQTATDYNVRVKSDCGSLTPVIPTAFNFTTASSSASCSPPTNITASSITSTGATISWTAASNAQNYKVEYKKSSETNWTIGTSSTTSTNYQITGLVAITGYNVRISTRCSNGATSSNSATVTFTTSAPEPCGVPTNVYAYAFSTQQARITWDAPTSNTNINGYTFEYKKDGATIWNTVTSNTTSINLTGLTINTTYNARISTNCTGGATSASTETVTFTTLASGCYGYTPVITVLSQTPNYAQISWSAVSTSSLYMVEYRKWHSNASDSWIVATPSTSSTYYTFNTLETNLVYSVRITALCEDGSIQQRSETIFYLDNGCHAPQDLTINDITSKSARFVYDYLSCNKSTKVEYKKSNEQTWTFVKEYATYFSCHVIDYLTGLTPNTSYDVRVTPSCGNSVTKAFITRDICAPPADIQVSDITAGSARISYSRASNATNYIYEYKRQSDANWTKFYNLDLGNNWVILTGLESANNYLVRITSSCVWDYNNPSQTSSEFSDASIEKSFTTNCQAMSSFSLSASQSQILVSWSSIFGANEYTVQYRRQSDVSWTSKPNTTATSLALTSLESATVYVVRIIVNCINGSSSSSNEQTVTTPSSSNNDECSGAIDLPTCSNTPLTGTTLGKTLSSIRPPINSNGYPDVWYKFTATARIHRMTTYHSSTNGASQQMIVGVLGDCNNPTSSLRSYINSNFYTSRTSSFDIYGLVTGTTYYVYVAGQNIDFTICTEAKTESSAPSNDAQSGAIVLSTAQVGAGCGASVSGSTVGATNLSSNVYRSDVWFKYTAVSSRHKYKFTNIRSLTGTNYGDFALSISPNGGSTSYGYNYIPSNTTRTFYNSTDQTISQDYYLNIGGAGMGFDLCTEAVPWSPAPPNDDSNTATHLSEISNCINGTTFGSNDGKVWFKFVATKTTHALTINNTKNQDGVAQVTLSPTLYKGSNLEIVSNLNMSNYTYPYTGNFTQALNNLTIGETYYILICGGCGGALTTTLYLTSLLSC